jgi:formylglycine-generating enzyme required for sulfatase activity
VEAALSNEFTSVQGSLTQITSEAPLPVGAIRWINDTGGGGTGNEVTVGNTNYPGSAALGAAYPKGYAAMYCMKYELSQGQYTDFLNSLTRAQQIRRVAVDISGDAPAAGLTYVMAETPDPATAFRSTITCPATGMGTTAPVQFTCTRPDRAANFLIWADGAAYLDWAGLRPLSELEYEKVCRGPLPVVPGELAGGAAPVAALNINGSENGTETTDAGANYVFGFQNFAGGDAGNGPLRCGIFATPTSTRAQAGAAYYGVMEMSGNVWERCVTVAEQDAGLPTNAGLFDGNRNGDGVLDSLGNHDVLTWPNSTDVLGSNYRGGNWSRPAEWAAVSDRQYGGAAIAGRTSHRSIRGGRSGATLSSAPQGTNGTSFNDAKYHGGSYDGYSQTVAQPMMVVGLQEEQRTGRLDVFPNPATDAITFQLAANAPALESVTLTVMDALGRTVRTLTGISGRAFRLDREQLAPGVYTFRLSDVRGPLANGRLVVK